jgi:hypothetical protein
VAPEKPRGFGANSILPYASVQDTVRVSAARSGQAVGTVQYTFSRDGTVNVTDCVRLTANVLPTAYAHLQDYPNPFSGSTTIADDVLEPARVTGKVWMNKSSMKPQGRQPKHRNAEQPHT